MELDIVVPQPACCNSWAFWHVWKWKHSSEREWWVKISPFSRSWSPFTDSVGESKSGRGNGLVSLNKCSEGKPFSMYFEAFTFQNIPFFFKLIACLSEQQSKTPNYSVYTFRQTQRKAVGQRKQLFEKLALVLAMLLLSVVSWQCQSDGWPLQTKKSPLMSLVVWSYLLKLNHLLPRNNKHIT